MGLTFDKLRLLLKLVIDLIYAVVKYLSIVMNDILSLIVVRRVLSSEVSIFTSSKLPLLVIPIENVGVLSVFSIFKQKAGHIYSILSFVAPKI